jgi:hypothetical protein
MQAGEFSINNEHHSSIDMDRKRSLEDEVKIKEIERGNLYRKGSNSSDPKKESLSGFSVT